jgi:hypothetical protein
MTTAFEFKQCMTLLKATGKKAGSLRELRDLIEETSPESLIHHTYRYFLKGHILEYANDFAHWAGKSLEESALAEQLSNIDPYACVDSEALRREILQAVDNHLERFPEPRKAIAGDEFFFNETTLFIFPAGVRAGNLAEFLIAVRYVDVSSLFYHFYDARLRLGNGRDDFSAWFETILGKRKLAETVRAIDPFMHTLEGIRERIAEAVEAEVKRDIESAGVGP